MNTRFTQKFLWLPMILLDSNTKVKKLRWLVRVTLLQEVITIGNFACVKEGKKVTFGPLREVLSEKTRFVKEQSGEALVIPIQKIKNLAFC